MRFDCTKGKPAKYMVSIYRLNGEDFYYFHYYKDAKKVFDSATTKEIEGTSISLWDMVNDSKKCYAKV